MIRSIPALWEVYDGRTLIGWVERAGTAPRPWLATGDGGEGLGRYRGLGLYRRRQDAERAVCRAKRKLS